MKRLQSILSGVLAGAMVLSVTACSTGSTHSPTVESTATKSSDSLDFATLKLGDNKDIKANLKFLTHRTDIVDTKFKQYIEDFQKDYPNVTIKYEAVANYADDITTRMTTKDWGDICMIPSSISNSEYADHFIAFGKVDELAKQYNFCTAKKYGADCFGISSTGNVQGIVYNKKVYRDAGITTLPKTPGEFINALVAIKEKSSGKVIPLYTNFAAKWTLGAWDAYIGGCATGDPDFTNIKLPKMKNPFAKSSFKEGTGPYAVYNILYEAVKQKLTEADPTTTDWESSKTKLNNGEIATMVLGSWAVTQIEQAGKNADNVGYMPFPITIDGEQCATIGSDYCYGINKFSSKDNQLAAMLYVKYLTEKSDFAFSEGGVPIVKGAQLPPSLSDFKSIKLIEDTPAKAGEEDLYTNVNNDSKLSLNNDNSHVQNVVEAALKGSKTMDQIAEEWNSAWSEAQKSNDVTAE